MSEHSSKADPHSQASAMETLTAMENALHAEYDPEFELTGDGWTKRYIARRKTDRVPVMVTVAAYPQALNADAIAWQQRFIPMLSQPILPSICPIISVNLQPWAQSVVSSLAGDESLFQMMRRLQQLRYLDVCLLLGSLAEAIETACQCHHVAPLLNAYALYLAPSTSPTEAPRIGLPVTGVPLPFSTDSGTWPNLMAMSGTSVFVPQLAKLACELLGLPVRSGKYRPIAQIGEHSSEVLRKVIDASVPYASVSDFILDFTGQPRTRPASQPHRPQDIIPPEPPTPTQSTATFRPIEPESKHPAPLAAANVVNAAPLSRLRIVPKDKPTLPTCGLVAGKEIWIGRSPAQSDFLTLFVPSSPRNDLRTQALSRKHCRLSVENGAVYFSDGEGVNQSFAGSQPLEGKVKPGSVGRVMVAGEYDLEIRLLTSTWDKAPIWQDSAAAEAPTGAASLSGPPTGVFPCIAALVHTDVAFSVKLEGHLVLGQPDLKDLVGWFLQRNGGLWIAAATNNGNIEINGRQLEPGTAWPLVKDDRLSICRVEYAVKSFT